MIRAANLKDRPLPLLFVYGNVASGKTASVALSAEVFSVTCIDVGSDSCEHKWSGKAGVSSPFSTAESWKRWLSVVQTTPYDARILVIDDADVLLHMAHNVTSAMLIQLASYKIPVIIIATDVYAVPALGELKRAKTGVTTVYCERPSAELATKILQEQFPTIDAKRIEFVVDECGADIRQARAQLSIEVVDKSPHVEYEPGRLSINEPTPWPILDALLGVGNAHFPMPVMVADADAKDDIEEVRLAKQQRRRDTMQTARQQLMTPYSSLLCNRVEESIYKAVAPKDIDACSAIADAIATADCIPSLREHTLLDYVPHVAQYSRATKGWKPNKISYKSGVKKSAKDSRAALVVELERHRFSTLKELDSGFDCPRYLTTAARRAVTSRRAIHWRQYDSDFIDAACSLAQLDERKTDMWSLDQIATALHKLGEKRPQPWLPATPAKTVIDPPSRAQTPVSAAMRL